MGERVEELLRELAPQVLGFLARRHGQFDACEDAVQEALLAAATQWPVEGVPDNPRAWLVTVGSRRLADLWRSDSARRRREEAVFAAESNALVAEWIALRRMPLKNARGSQMSEQTLFQKLSRTLRRETKASKP